MVPSEPLAPRFTLDSVMVRSNVHFDQISRALDRPVEEVAQLNPQYRKNVVPGAVDGGWPVVMPVHRVGMFLDSLPAILEREATRVPEVTFEPEVIVYRVKSGDVLGTIARKHRVSIRDLKTWNGLRGDMTVSYTHLRAHET